jgi:hypothetical protein
VHLHAWVSLRRARRAAYTAAFFVGGTRCGQARNWSAPIDSTTCPTGSTTELSFGTLSMADLETCKLQTRMASEPASGVF